MARAVAEGAARALARLTESLAAASDQRQAAEQASRGRAAALKEIRVSVRDLAAELDRVVDAAHGTEMARAEHRMRLEQLVDRVGEEFGVSGDAGHRVRPGCAGPGDRAGGSGQPRSCR